jgi:hypothetical protein
MTPSDVLVNGEIVGVCWPARGGGLTLRTGPSLVRPRVHHFSASEGEAGLRAYIERRFGAEPVFVPHRQDRDQPLFQA